MEHQTSSRATATTAIALAASVAIAFALRVLPAYGVVFAHGIVNFQEPDGWFHVRTVHNLLAHFPRRSGFDPYALFPGGQDIPTAPVWDYVLASAAWLLGLGAPSPALIDRVAAWLPAILGALYPIPAFFLGRRLFGGVAGAFAALWVAVCRGDLLWITHLGLSDHHALEGLLAFLTLGWMCAAVHQRSSSFAWLAGIALGLFLGTRPAGIFVPATLACLVVLEPPQSAMVLRAVLAAAVVFLPASGGQWSEYTWLTLASTGALAAAVLALDTLAGSRGWAPRVRQAAPFAILALGVAAALLAMPHLFSSLWFEITRMAGFGPASRMVSTVQELQPIYRAGPKHGWPSILESVGVIWVAAIPVLLWMPAGPARPASRLLALWTVVMGIATIMQVRMAIYFLPPASVLAGAACAWLSAWLCGLLKGMKTPRRPITGVPSGSPQNAIQPHLPSVRVLASVVAVLVLAINLPWAIPQLVSDGGNNADWLDAFNWLRDNSPEPLGDAGAWSRYYPRAESAGAHTTGAWGVAIWWDRAYALEQIAHRIPMSNGTQAGADEMARFYTETIPEAAVAWLRRSGARYVVVDPQAPLFAGQSGSRFPVLIRMLGRNMDSYTQILAEPAADGELRSVPVYLPTYYQTMVARLYLADGERVDGTGPWVFETEPAERHGKKLELIVSSRHFASETEAAGYLTEHQSARLTVGCLDAGKSCLSLPAVRGLKRVFSSDPLPISPQRTVRAVKIFQVMPEE